MGVFNGLTTWIESIVKPRGFTTEDAGNLGAVILVAGLVGAIVLAALSDKQRKRRRFIVLGLLVGAPGIAGIAFATSIPLLFAAGAWAGFWMTGVMPVGFQYASEITRPTPEGTSSGLAQLCGQASVVFVGLMSVTRTADGAFTPSLIASVVLLIVAGLIALGLEEPAHA